MWALPHHEKTRMSGDLRFMAKIKGRRRAAALQGPPAEDEAAAKCEEFVRLCLRLPTSDPRFPLTVPRLSPRLCVSARGLLFFPCSLAVR